MSQPAIEVSGLSKRYVIQHESRHDNLRDTLHHSARKLWRKLRWGTGFEKEDFWALSDISFSVQPGEVLGIIGRNGAGKSTLLKVLSRITEPTTGKIKLRGRVASLLEVGTGFHPELSGRENIFLNGAILGMRRSEIKARFDQIVAFAEVERFLDTPVKRYSSGMYVRLAFAVAAHLEPDILIVDEVLAVGDSQFQKKCLGKIREVSRMEGRTVIFVSHNLLSVRELCSRVIRLADGQLAGDGAPDNQIEAHLGASTATDTEVSFEKSERSKSKSKIVRYLSARMEGHDNWLLPFGESLDLQLKIKVEQTIGELEFGVSLCTAQGQEICSTLSIWDSDLGIFSSGIHEVFVRFPPIDLAPGHYQIGIGVKSGHGMEDHIPEALRFQVIASALSAERPRLYSIRGAIAQEASFSRSKSSQ